MHCVLGFRLEQLKQLHVAHFLNHVLGRRTKRVVGLIFVVDLVEEIVGEGGSRACVLRAPRRLHQPGFRGAPGSEHLSTHHALLASGPRASWAHPLPATPFQCPRSRTETLG